MQLRHQSNQEYQGVTVPSKFTRRCRCAWPIATAGLPQAEGREDCAQTIMTQHLPTRHTQGNEVPGAPGFLLSAVPRVTRCSEVRSKCAYVLVCTAWCSLGEPLNQRTRLRMAPMTRRTSTCTGRNMRPSRKGVGNTRGTPRQRPPLTIGAIRDASKLMEGSQRNAACRRRRRDFDKAKSPPRRRAALACSQRLASVRMSLKLDVCRRWRRSPCRSC